MAARIPEPARVPLLGHVPALLLNGPLHYYEQQWRRLGDVFAVRIRDQRLVVVAHPDAVEHVLVGHGDVYTKGRGYDDVRRLVGDSMLTTEREVWRAKRRLAQPSFHRSAIRNKLVPLMMPAIDRSLEQLREHTRQGVAVDAHEFFMALTLNVVGETLFGQHLSVCEREASANAFGSALSYVSKRANSIVAWPWAWPTPGNLKMRRSLQALRPFVHKIVTRARERVATGETPQVLLEMLIASRDPQTQQGLTDCELHDEVTTIALAGHETTALALTWCVAILADHPQVVARMHEEVASLGAGPVGAQDIPRLGYLEQVLKETMRLRPPVWTLARDVVQPDVVAGFLVQPGDVVTPMQWLVHRHPDFWSHPAKFDPERFAPGQNEKRHRFAYFPFSIGPRVCIGNTFALYEGMLVLASLLQRARFRFCGERPVKMRPSVTLRPAGAVMMRVDWQ